MPVIPFIPLIAAGVGGGLTYAASRPSSQQKQALSAESQLANEQAQNAAQGRQLATQYSDMAHPALTNAMNYWQTLASGDRTALSSFLGPDITRYAEGQQAAGNTVSQFAPRGGARTTTLADLPFAQARTVGDMFASVRPMANAQLGNMGEGTASLGLNALGQSTGAAGSAANNYLGQVALIEGLRQNQANNAAKAGGNFYTWAKGVDWKNIFGGGGRGGINSDPNDPSICWIAAELWGWQDSRTHTVRNWILAEHPGWARLYQFTGKSVATAMRRSRSVRALAEMLFTDLLGKARES